MPAEESGGGRRAPRRRPALSATAQGGATRRGAQREGRLSLAAQQMARAAGALALALALAAGLAPARAQQVVGRPRAALEQLAAFLDDPAAPLPWRAQLRSSWAWLSALPSLHSRSPPPSLPGVSDECKDGLRALADGVRNRELWALRMADASTKAPDGLLFGNLVHLGNFDECLAVRRGRAGAPGSFRGRHCLVTLTAQLPLGGGGGDGPWAAAARDARAELRFLATQGLRADAALHIPVQIAWCAPSSCSPGDLQAAAQAAVNASLPEGAVRAAVDPALCHTRGARQLRGVDVFAICLLAAFVALAAASTAFDVITRRRGRRQPLLLAFSLRYNWPKLIAVKSGDDQLSYINGIRVLSMGWVVLGHVYLLNAISPAINSLDFLEKFVRAPERLLFMNGTVVVDSFLVMSGFLLSFLFLKEVRRTNHFEVLKFYVHRYVRLTPVLAVLLLLTVTITNYAGTGPLWDSVHNKLREHCEQNWWTNILYVNNYVHPDNMCLRHTWYLAVDMQLYWLSPLVLVPLWKLPKRPALLWLCFLMVLGWAITFTIVYLMEIQAGTYVGTREKQTESINYYYLPTHTRYVPWLLGVLLGYVLQEARHKKPEIPGWAVALGWALAAGCLVGAVLGAYPFQQPDYVYDRVQAAFWLSLFRNVWALGVAWVIFACDQGFGGMVNKILSWRAFQPLGRFCYCMYLTHAPILFMLGSAAHTTGYLADVNMISQTCGTIFMSVAFSIPLILLFESPIIFIEKIILRGEGIAEQNHDRIYCVQRNRSKEWRIEHGKRW